MPYRNSSNWRHQSNDAVNCLFLMLRRAGYESSYRVFLESTLRGRKCTNATEMRQLSHELGYPLSIRALNLDELRDTALPIIVYLDGPDLGKGHYSLLLSLDDDKTIEMLNGPSLLFETIPRDSFLRTWSGYGITVRASAGYRLRSPARQIVALTLLAIALASVIYSKVRKCGVSTG